MGSFFVWFFQPSDRWSNVSWRRLGSRCTGDANIFGALRNLVLIVNNNHSEYHMYSGRIQEYYIFSCPLLVGEYPYPWKSRLTQKSLGSIQISVSENSGTPKSSILIGFSIINHPFWGTPIFGNIQIDQRFSGLVGRKKPVLQSWTSPVISEVFVSFILVSQDLRDIVTFILHTAKSPHDQVLGSGS